jgi:hypothetical protein
MYTDQETEKRPGPTRAIEPFKKKKKKKAVSFSMLSIIPQEWRLSERNPYQYHIMKTKYFIEMSTGIR